LSGGPIGEIAEAFNEVVELNQRMTRSSSRLGDIRRQGRQDWSPGQSFPTTGFLGVERRDGQQPDRRLWCSRPPKWLALIGAVVCPAATFRRPLINHGSEGRPLGANSFAFGNGLNTDGGQLWLLRLREVDAASAREVGTEGKPRRSGQDERGSGPGRTDLTTEHDAANLTNQVRNIAEVSPRLANGDLSKRFGDVKGEILELKNTINTRVDQLNSFASEVTRVAREVGTKQLGGQANVRGVAGTGRT